MCAPSKTEETCMTRASPPTGPPARSIFFFSASLPSLHYLGSLRITMGVTFYFLWRFFLTVFTVPKGHKKPPKMRPTLIFSRKTGNRGNPGF